MNITYKELSNVMVPKKLIVALAKIANDLDSVNLKKEATAIDRVWIRLAYGNRDYSRFQDLKDHDGMPYDFDLDSTSFNQSYDLPHPDDAEDYWDDKLKLPSEGSLEAIDDEIKEMAYQIGGQLNADDGSIRNAWMDTFDQLLSPIGFQPTELQPNWKEEAHRMLSNHLKMN